MSTAGLQAANKQNAKELDSMKESISDIINQLQDIDPTRLSFSPFLDLDTQISLAPVSDSPESSVEELHSSSQSLSGSQHSLEQPPATSRTRGSAPRHQHPADGLPRESQAAVAEEKERDPDASGPDAAAERSADATAENGVGGAPPAPGRGTLPNGVNAARRGPEPAGVDSTADEGRPLMSPPPESVELAVWVPEGRAEPREAPPEPPRHGRCCCQCGCCLSGRVPAFLSVLASLLCAAGICYALYFHVPVKPPDCPDAASRITFALCCCVVASVPVLLAMLAGAACQFCTASFGPQPPPPSSPAPVPSAGWALQQLFVAASLQQLVLYVLNLAVLAALLPQDKLKLVPVLVTLFICGRLVYWLSLNACSSWRGFGSGLTVFPLLGVVGLNLFLMYTQNLSDPLLGSQDVLYNQVTPSSWSGGASQSPRGAADVLPTDILDAQ